MRAALNAAQADLRRARERQKTGAATDGEVEAASQRVGAAAAAFGPAMMRYQAQRQVMRDMQKRLEQLTGGTRPRTRPRRTVVAPPPPP